VIEIFNMVTALYYHQKCCNDCFS